MQVEKIINFLINDLLFTKHDWLSYQGHIMFLGNFFLDKRSDFRKKFTKRKFHDYLMLVTSMERLLTGASFELTPSGTPAHCSTS